MLAIPRTFHRSNSHECLSNLQLGPSLRGDGGYGGVEQKCWGHRFVAMNSTHTAGPCAIQRHCPTIHASEVGPRLPMPLGIPLPKSLPPPLLGAPLVPSAVAGLPRQFRQILLGLRHTHTVVVTVERNRTRTCCPAAVDPLAHDVMLLCRLFSRLFT